MELVKDIYFNTDKLVENAKVKVSYTGKFYQGNNDKVFIHYGYGENWNNVKDSEMIKTDLGYQTELDLVGGNTLNFCFKNQNNEWDNNNGQNYVFAIESATTNNLGTTTVGATEEASASFFGKTFGEPQEATSNVYWNTELEANSGVVEGTDTPTSVDTYIDTIPTAEPTIATENAGNIIGADGIANLNAGISADALGTPSLDTVVTPTANIGDTVLGTTANTGTVAGTPNKNSIFKFIPTTNETPAVVTNALAVVNTGFQKTVVWTKKIKTQVCKFFSYVPKFISGNYKRKIEDKK